MFQVNHLKLVKHYSLLGKSRFEVNAFKISCGVIRYRKHMACHVNFCYYAIYFSICTKFVFSLTYFMADKNVVLYIKKRYQKTDDMHKIVFIFLQYCSLFAVLPLFSL